MNSPTHHRRSILALSDVDLETFVRDWISIRLGRHYNETANFAGTGDLGRDAVGFETNQRHEGAWHNFQCKQYAGSISTETGIAEVGKILYYASEKKFSTPSSYSFVAPKGVNRNLEFLIFNPTEFKRTLISEWDKYCSKSIKKNTAIPLSQQILDTINGFNFSNIYRLDINDILLDADINPVLHKWFGEKLLSPPTGIVPTEFDFSELPYVNKLISAYEERDSIKFSSHDEVRAHPVHGGHIQRQRERYYDADAFKRFYRDSVEKDVIINIENDIYYGVVDVCGLDHQDTLECIDKVMIEAGKISASGPLAEHARVPVKQGICHHLANTDRIKWKK